MRALNAFVADVYGDGCILSGRSRSARSGPGCPQFRRAAVGIKPPLGNFVTVAGIDLVRGVDGRFYVLEDNVRTPERRFLRDRKSRRHDAPGPDTDAGIARAQRRALSRRPAAMPDGDVAHRQIQSDHRAAHAGPYNSAFFEHVFLSQQMGIELVEGRDLVCVDRQTLHEGRSRPAADRRALPPHRRRLPRPAGVPPRLAAGRAGADRGAARRQRRDRQRRRHRSRRRQGGLRLHARDDSLLSGRGADSSDRRDLSCCATRSPRAGAEKSRAIRRQAHRRIGRLRRRDRTQGERSELAATRERIVERSIGLHRAAGDCAVGPSDDHSQWL